MQWKPPEDRPLTGVKTTMQSKSVVKVLDHGFVHLRDSMPHVNLGPDETVADVLGPGDYRIEEAARISTSHLHLDVLIELGLSANEDERSAEKTKKLIRYMFEHAHTTPFEQVRFTFVARLPIFIARQWIRHRTGSFNEQSARYGELQEMFYVPSLDRMQAQSSANKQGSAQILAQKDGIECRDEIIYQSHKAYEGYQRMLKLGLTRELARMVLPTNFYTQWYWTTDLHNLMHFLSKRCAHDAQYEIRVYADAMLEMAALVAPFTISLFREKYGFGAQHA
jgi:thymidylate synthase (FAD)